MNHVLNFMRNESGATAIEYALIASLIAVAIIGAVTTVGTKVSISVHRGRQLAQLRPTPFERP